MEENLGLEKICILNRRSPLEHRMLNSFIAFFQARGINASYFNILGSPNNFKSFFIEGRKSDLILTSDPIVFLCSYALFYFSRKKLIFFSFEMFEYQKDIKNLKTFTRFIFFKLLHHFALYFSSKAVFSNLLRKNFYCKRIKSLEKKALVFENLYYSPIDLPHKKDTLDHLFINEIHEKFETKYIYAGAIQEGRELLTIINAFGKTYEQNKKDCLILCGPKKTNIKLPDNCFYIGNISFKDMRKVYDITDYGFLTYSNKIKNTQLCAPVKLYEYLKFGIIPIANDNFSLSQKNHLIPHYYKSEDDIIKIIKKPKSKSLLPPKNEEELSFEKNFTRILQSITN